MRFTSNDDFYLSNDVEVVTEVWGGECTDILHNYVGVEFQCGGVCRKNIKIRKPFFDTGKPMPDLFEGRYMQAPIVGYPHDAGQKDKDGHKWWLYVHCPDPNCGYDTAIWKVARLRKVAEYKDKVAKEEAEFESHNT